MHVKKIKRILLIEIIKEYINILIFFLVISLLIFLGYEYSYFAYLFLVFFIIGVLANFFQTSKEKSLYKELYKISKYSDKKLLKAIDDYLCTVHENREMPVGFNYVNRNQSAKRSMRHSRSNNVGNVTVNSTIRFLRSSRRVKVNQYNSELDKKLETLIKLKRLLEPVKVLEDAWEI